MTLLDLKEYNPEELDKKIMDRAQCICEICQQCKWRTCETHAMDYHCSQLISKFADHDYPYMAKNYHFEDGTTVWYKKIAGIKTSIYMLDEYVDYITEALTKSKIHSCDMMDAIKNGKLDGRKKLQPKVLKSIGFVNSMIEQPSAQLYLGALDKYANHLAKKILREKSDFDIEMEERRKEVLKR